jgi:hypothetical protein
MLKIEQFIEEQFGIKLNSQQLQIITMMSTGQISLSQSINKKVFGNDIVQKSVYAWLQHGLVKTNKPDISNHHDMPIGTPGQYINEQQMIRIAHLNTGIKQLNKGVENAS